MNGQVSYTLYLDLRPDKFRGACLIKFNANQIDNIFLDYQGKQLTYLNINNTEIDKEDFKVLWVKNKLNLPSGLLMNGENEILVRFQSFYDNST